MFDVCFYCNLMFYNWRECVMTVLGTKNILSATVLTLCSKVVLYCVDRDIGGLRPQCNCTDTWQ